MLPFLLSAGDSEHRSANGSAHRAAGGSAHRGCVALQRAGGSGAGVARVGGVACVPALVRPAAAGRESQTDRRAGALGETGGGVSWEDKGDGGEWRFRERARPGGGVGLAVFGLRLNSLPVADMKFGFGVLTDVQEFEDDVRGMWA